MACHLHDSEYLSLNVYFFLHFIFGIHSLDFGHCNTSEETAEEVVSGIVGLREIYDKKLNLFISCYSSYTGVFHMALKWLGSLTASVRMYSPSRMDRVPFAMSMTNIWKPEQNRSCKGDQVWLGRSRRRKVHSSGCYYRLNHRTEVAKWSYTCAAWGRPPLGSYDYGRGLCQEVKSSLHNRCFHTKVRKAWISILSQGKERTDWQKSRYKNKLPGYMLEELFVPSSCRANDPSECH